MDYCECDYYHRKEDRTGYCELNESVCLAEAFNDACPELVDEDEAVPVGYTTDF